MSIRSAKTLRGNMTDVERRLWYRLRAHRFGGHKFKRQVPIGPYVVSRKIVIEVDGGQHVNSQTDPVRDAYLGGEGFQVLRFWNNDVLGNTQGVLKMILTALDPSPGALRAPPSPPAGERGK